MMNEPWLIRADKGEILYIRGPHGRELRRQKYRVQAEHLVTRLGGRIPALLEDLVTLASTVYAADRFIRRNQAPSEPLQQRHLEVEVPVSDADRWNDSAVRHALCNSLSFMTEDAWHFRFYSCSRRGVRYATQLPLFPPRPPVATTLFSGGLDSLAGLLLQVIDGRYETIVPLACGTSSRLLRKQRLLLDPIRKLDPNRIKPVMVPVRLHQSGKDYNFNERSQRARGFLFSLLGAVAAIAAGGRELFIYENGVGAINLPISDAQIGVQSARGVNPVALRYMELLLGAVLGFQFSLRLPNLFLTKGDMCSRLPRESFKRLALRSVSCDGFPSRIAGPEHCGVCTSCLLRRQSLWAAGLRDDLCPGQYRYDVLSHGDQSMQRRLAPLWDMLDQADRLDQATTSINPWHELEAEFPELREIAEVLTEWPEPRSRSDVERDLIQLYQRYVDEWRKFPARPHGWSSNNFTLPLSA